MPDRSDVKDRIEELREEIARHDRLYYVENAPEISDAEYDRLFAELERLEEENPDLVTEESPTQRVGAEPVSELGEIDHVAPMLSLDAVLEKDDIADFVERMREEGGEEGALLVAEPKFDGLSVEAVFDEGRFLHASTRGNGETGEDITHTLRTVRALPLRLDGDDVPTGRVAFYGEAILPKSSFQEINGRRIERGEEPFANPRNAAAGVLRRLDPAEAENTRFAVSFYDASGIDAETAPTQWALLDRLRELGLPVAGDRVRCDSVEDVAAFHGKLEAQRDDLDYEIDGIVLKLNARSARSRLGTRSRSPRWAIAWKFPPRTGETRIADIVVSVGRTGVLTPVALLDPVDVGGVTVARATLHNIEEVHRKDLRIGDTVRIERAGDVIPEVAERVPKPGVARADPFEMPGTCPSCGAEVERRGPLAYCPAGISCPAQLQARLVHYAASDAMDIDGLGEETAAQLVSTGLVENLGDLYDLTAEDIEALDGFAERSAAALHDAIRSRRDVPLDRFLFALGIPLIGRDAARRLARAFGSLDALEKAGQPDLEAVDGIGEAAAESVAAFFAEERNREVLARLSEAGVSPRPPEKASSGLEGLTFVLTGALDRWTREEATEEIESRGGRVSSSVSGQTDYVVVGEDPGSKLDDAKAEGVKTLDEDAFANMLD